ncbi:MAG: AAA-like domain-containing protein [Byssovorax sp.]
MRRFSSYGPVNPAQNFCVERRDLVERCVAALVDDPDVGGHYFTIWAPRQTGKTWTMRRAVEEIRARYGDRFVVGFFSMQGVVLDDDQPEEAFFKFVPHRFQLGFGVEAPMPASWDDWSQLFARKGGYFDRPVILCIDEFDSLPRKVIDRLVALFRDIYLSREGYFLHGLALIGVRSVLGVDSERGSPFNVQRSLPIPNLTQGEVRELFAQYQAESGQVVEPAVVDAVFEVTRGQPGLVSWFGELCAEKYNPGPEQAITASTWRRVYSRACQAEWNNTLLNLVKKARAPHLARVLTLFTDPNVPFSMDKDWCSYLYMNGIIDPAEAPEGGDGGALVCRFSSPFVQRRLYAALTDDMFGDRGPILAVEPIDTLSDVFTPEGLCLPPLLERYRAYLKRLKARGIDPWVGQPRRADLHLTEAVGHFHLYAWLRDALGGRCLITPEFPTGNGKVDLVLKAGEAMGVIEVKSFVNRYELEKGHAQTAGYAKKLGLAEATMAVFVPVEEAAVPKELSGEVTIDGVTVTVVALGWV